MASFETASTKPTYFINIIGPEKLYKKEHISEEVAQKYNYISTNNDLSSEDAEGILGVLDTNSVMPNEHNREVLGNESRKFLGFCRSSYLQDLVKKTKRDNIQIVLLEFSNSNTIQFRFSV